MYRQEIDPLGHLPLSALLAALPLLVLLILLGAVRMKSHWAGLTGLAVALALAVGVYGMPLRQAADGALEGAAFGLLPIVWIILNAVWINKLQRVGGHFDIIGRAFSSLSTDFRVQTIVVAFCFGAMIESLSGFGTPIAVTALILMTIGLTPLKAAAVATFANTAPAAFGSVGNPIEALAKATSLPAGELGAMVGRQSAVIASLVPFALLMILDGRRGLRQVWPAALVAGLGFGAGQFVCSNFFVEQLTDLVAATTATGAVVLLLRFWSPVPAGPTRPAPPRPTGPPAPPDTPRVAPATTTLATPATTLTTEAPGTRRRLEVLKAFSPYALLTVLFALTSVEGPVARFVRDRGVTFRWPGLNVLSPQGAPVTAATFDLNWLGTSGTMLLLTGVLTALVLRVPPRAALRCYGQAFRQIRWAVLTISCVLALSYVMNLSGMAISLGTCLAGLGSVFALLSGFLGWFGVALTGSDTSSNALFGGMQIAAAHRIGISPLLMAATNSTGGVQGKAAAMQNLAIAAGAVGLPGKEGDILRKVIGWSLALLAVFCVLAFLQSTVLTWTIPGG
ncbi:L-lactate permease [Streptomyces celluloflavus]|uniref:L-lactate permease n=1 Tax=Streptomyces celluloflavus TaxID=58344 RepID=UPI003667CA79